MKQICKISLESYALLCASTLLFSLIFATLYYFMLISTNTFHIANWICGIISFAAGGVLLGMLAQKKALLHAFVLVLILLILCMLLTSSYQMMSIVKTLSKCFSYLLGCMIAYAKKKKA